MSSNLEKQHTKEYNIIIIVILFTSIFYVDDNTDNKVDDDGAGVLSAFDGPVYAGTAQTQDDS